jgi:hypothetical protein
MISLRKVVGGATWARFAAVFAAWGSFNWFAFLRPSPWTRALSAGGGALPESKFGFPADEPQRSLARLAEKGATGDYLLWQALDIPYAALNLAAPALAMALALKATKLGASPLRLALLLPAVYFGAELVENGLVAGFAAGPAPPARSIVAVQQAATNLKLFSGYGSMILAVAALAVAAAAALFGVVRNRR